jgi:hypothetical protein
MAALLLLLLFAAVHAQMCPDDCITNADCLPCKNDPMLGHRVFVQNVFNASVSYVCEASTCKLNATLARLNPSLLAQCHSLAGASCCIPPISGILLDDLQEIIDVCGPKKCKNVAFCNPRGFCEYSAIDRFTACCQEDNDCPDVPAPFPSDPIFGVPQACGQYQCVVSDCVLRNKPGCCNNEFNCGTSPLSTVPYFCAANPPVTDSGTCVLALKAGTPCSSDSNCGGDGSFNQCAKGVCSGSVCTVTPRQVGITPGCCNGNTTFCPTSNICRKLIGCDDTSRPVPQFTGVFGARPPFTLLPTYRCQYKDFGFSGCCTVNSQCAELSNKCVKNTCNLLTNQCVAEPDPVDTTTRCGQYSAECGKPPLPTSYYEVELPTEEDNSELYVCILKPVVPLPPSPPINGISPTMTLYPPTADCIWSSCASSNRNTLQFAYDFEVSGDNNGPLYDADVLLRFVASTGTNVTQAVRLVNITYLASNPSYSNAVGSNDRVFDDSNVVITFVSFVAGTSTYKLEVLPQGTFAMWPFERVRVIVDVVIVPVSGLTTLATSSELIGYDTCQSYYEGTTNGSVTCTPSLFGQRFHRFTYVTSSFGTAFFGSGTCVDAPLCFPTIPGSPPPPPSGFTLPFPTSPSTVVTTAPPTLAPPVFTAGQIGGLVFLDQNGDSRFNALDGDQRLNNYRVNVHLASTGAITVATRTDPLGFYQFNRTLLFSAAGLNPAALDVYIGVLDPNSLIRSPPLPASSNVLESSFVADALISGGSRAPTAFGAVLPVDVKPMSVGFRDRVGTCAPSLAPLPSSAALLLSVQQSDADACFQTVVVDEDTSSSSSLETSTSDTTDEEPVQKLVNGDECVVTCFETPQSTYRRVQYDYTLDNSRSPVIVHASSVVANLQLGADTQALCVRPVVTRLSDGLDFLNSKTIYEKGTARITLSHGEIEPGDSLSFTAFFSICLAPGSSLVVNSTLTAQNNRCIRRIQDWRSCAEPQIDVSDCLAARPVDLSSASGCRIVDPSERTRTNTTLLLSTLIEREPATCVSNRRIATFQCDETANITGACLTSSSARSVVVATTTLFASGSEESEAGTLSIRLKSGTSRRNRCALQVSMHFEDPALPGAEQPVEERAKVLNTDSKKSTIDIAFSPIAPGSKLVVRLMALQCVGLAPTYEYTLEADLRTELCESRLFCFKTTAELPTQPVPDDRPCIDPLSFGGLFPLHSIRDERRALATEVSDAASSAIFWWILISLVGVCVLLCVAYLVMRANRRRRRR